MSAAIVAPAELHTATRAAAKPRLLWLLLLFSALILTLGLVDDLYANTDFGDVYGSDAIQYLDIARNLQRHDWHSALNPLWSQGYPAILAATRPLFAAGPLGDWHNTRVVNFAIFAADYAAFLWLLFALLGRIGEEDDKQTPKLFLWTTALALFTVTQLCLGQVARVNPDELVNACFFLACGIILRWLHTPKQQQPWKLATTLGLLLGAAFLIKAIFLMLGLAMLLLLALALRQQRRSLKPLAITASVFIIITGAYGAALSHAVGHITLGESGSLNYAWHVDRLQKWVHWEGGNQSASAAWPKPSIARFAQWDTKPPDFGKPLHPSVIAQEQPRIYSFSAPFHATYTPYYNPPYWYAGYRHIVNARYQFIAIVKSLGDLAQAVATRTIFFAAAITVIIALRRKAARQACAESLCANWPIAAISLIGIAIYIPVHLEGRYLAAFLALLPLTLIAASAGKLTRTDARALTVLLLCAAAIDIGHDQLPGWKNMLHHRSATGKPDWREGKAILAEHFAPQTPVAVVDWQPSLISDWAYIGDVEITSEIASPADLDLFWRQSPDAQQRTLATFHRLGVAAVIAPNLPATAGPGWRKLPDSTMGIYRF